MIPLNRENLEKEKEKSQSTGRDSVVTGLCEPHRSLQFDTRTVHPNPTHELNLPTR